MKHFLGLIVALLLVSCGGTNTVVLDSWKDPSTTIEKENFKKVLVIALVKNDLVRKRIESRFKEINPIFYPSNHFLNEKSGVDKEMLLKLLKSENADGVLTMRLVDVTNETSYVPGTTSTYYNAGYMNTYGYGTMFGGWYGLYSPMYYSPGYYVENSYYIVETNIFSLESNKLIWSAVTKTLQFSDIEGGLDDILASLAEQMRKDGSLSKEKKK
jgi:hypothetical protein